MATNEMRAWLEKKIIAIEEWLPKIEKWTEDFMTAKRDIEMMQAILAALERKKPTVSKMSDGWWLHITGKDGKMADVFLGPNHGPIVESVLNDNADKGNVPVFNEEGNSNE